MDGRDIAAEVETAVCVPVYDLVSAVAGYQPTSNDLTVNSILHRYLPPGEIAANCKERQSTEEKRHCIDQRTLIEKTIVCQMSPECFSDPKLTRYLICYRPSSILDRAIYKNKSKVRCIGCLNWLLK